MTFLYVSTKILFFFVSISYYIYFSYNALSNFFLFFTFTKLKIQIFGDLLIKHYLKERKEYFIDE